MSKEDWFSNDPPTEPWDNLNQAEPTLLDM